jgi:integrase
MAAKKHVFTDRYLASLKPPENGKRVIIFDAAFPSFGIRLGGGSDDKMFVLVTRINGGNPVTLTIGKYGEMSLAKARAKARQLKADIAEGVDPREQKRAKIAAARAERANTVASVFLIYADQHLAKLRTRRDVVAAFHLHILPTIGAMPIKAVTRRDLRAITERIAATAPTSARRVKSYYSHFFNKWCVAHDFIETSPAFGIESPGREVERERTLLDFEVAALWKAAEGLGYAGDAIRFLLAVGQRRNEVGAMLWSELDLDALVPVWRLPGSRAKNGKPHEIPLGALALDILSRQEKVGVHVFTAGNGHPVRNWDRTKKILDARMAAALGGPIERWTIHDLRRSYATGMARLGIDRNTVSKLLNHSEGGITRLYDRHARGAEKAAAANLWDRRLAAIVSGDVGGNVVPFAGRAL